jgi:hypothetical protein
MYVYIYMCVYVCMFTCVMVPKEAREAIRSLGAGWSCETPDIDAEN